MRKHTPAALRAEVDYLVKEAREIAALTGYPGDLEIARMFEGVALEYQAAADAAAAKRRNSLKLERKRAKKARNRLDTSSLIMPQIRNLGV